MSLLSRTWTVPLIACLMLQMITTVARGAPPVADEALAERRKSIAALPDAARQELIRKYEQYQQLTPEERNKLQNLHDVMEAEPDLKKVMDRYCDWLKNLDLTQREQLRQAKTPEQKRNLVSKFYQAQVQRKEDAWRNANPLPPEKQRLPVPLLNGSELKKVMTALESECVKEGILDSKTQNALASAPGTQRYKLLVRAIGEYHHPAGGPQREFEIPQTVKTTLEEVIRQGEGRQKLNELLRNGDRLRNMRNMFFYLLARSTAEEARHEFRGSDAGPLKLALFNALPTERQTQFSQAPPDKRDPLLMRMHLDEIWTAFSKAGDFPRFDGDGPGRGRPGDFPLQFRNGDGNRRSIPGRKDLPTEGRLPKKE